MTHIVERLTESPVMSSMYLLQRYSQVLNLDLVTAVVKPSSAITRSDRRMRLLHRLQQSFVGAPTKLSQNVLDLGERLLNGVFRSGE
jgi:hypothetical protein